VEVEVDRKGWNGDNPRRRQWSSTTAAVFRRLECRKAVRKWLGSFFEYL
jgi:hypothetical protein